MSMCGTLPVGGENVSAIGSMRAMLDSGRGCVALEVCFVVPSMKLGQEVLKEIFRWLFTAFQCQEHCQFGFGGGVFHDSLV